MESKAEAARLHAESLQQSFAIEKSNLEQQLDDIVSPITERLSYKFL